jgi:hypothetical protein
MRVLWAWARKHEEATVPMAVYHRYLSKVDGGECQQWRIAMPYGSGIRIEAFSTPEAATIVLAQCLVAQDAELVGMGGYP